MDIYDKLSGVVRGKVLANAPLAALTCFGVGGAADVLFVPSDIDDLKAGLKAAAGAPITILGGCSNVLIRDGGIRGLVVLMTGLDGGLGVAADGIGIKCLAGARSAAVSEFAADKGISGFEFLCGIPGTIAGAVIGNAGAYGGAMSDVVESVELVDFAGNEKTLANSELGFGYRKSSIPPNYIIVSVGFRGQRGDPAAIRQKMKSNMAQRLEKQPVGFRTCGSLFKNPPGDFAARLMDEAGLRGRRVGDAAISEKHANFLLNVGNATAAEMESLGMLALDEVFLKFGITLEWEIKILGDRA